MESERVVVGCMTGTSLDGIDVACVGLDGHGPDLRVGSLEHASTTFGEGMDDLRRFAAGHPLPASRIREIAATLGHEQAALIRERWPGLVPDLVVVHGQTVTHRPPLSWQLVDPWPIAAGLGAPVVHDLRGADLAAGGQGAPITPLADAFLYRPSIPDPGRLLVVNLGGFANATVLAPGDPGAAFGFDCCPCNHLLDAASRVVLDRPFDEGGLVAASGRADAEQAERLRRAVGSLARESRSGGDGDEHREAAVETARSVLRESGPADALATVATAVATAIVDGIEARSAESCPVSGRLAVAFAGGGVRNRGLMDALNRRLDRWRAWSPADPAPFHEVLPAAREAAGMAVLGALAADGVAITTRASTGRRDQVLPAGCWVAAPGARPTHGI